MKQVTISGRNLRIRYGLRGLVRCQRPCATGGGRWTTFSSRYFEGSLEEFRRWAREYVRTVEGIPDAEIRET